MKKLLSMLLAFLLALSLTACGKQSAEDYIVSEMEKFKAGEGLESTADDLSPEILQALLDNFSYSILSAEEDGDTATVRVQITNLDMVTAVTNWFPQLFVLALDQSMLPAEQQMSEAELDTVMYDLLYACMTAEDISLVTTDVTLGMTRTDESWKLDDVSMATLTDAMMGGFFSAMAALG